MCFHLKWLPDYEHLQHIQLTKYVTTLTVIDSWTVRWKKKLWWDTPIGLIKFRREKTSIRNWVLVPSVPSVRSYSTQFFWHCVLVRYSHWTNIMQYGKPLYPASLITVTVIFIIMVVGILTANIETKHSPRTCSDSFNSKKAKEHSQKFSGRNSMCMKMSIHCKYIQRNDSGLM